MNTTHSALSPTATPVRQADNGPAQRRWSLHIAVVGAILMVNSVIATYFFYDDPVAGRISAVAGAIVVSLPVMVFAVRDLLHGRARMNELVAIAVAAAFVMGKYEEAAVIAFFMILAIVAEEKTATGARMALEGLMRLTPSVARRVSGGSVEVVEISATELVPGDFIQVRPGENFPADGVIVSGNTTVNQATFTGESLPVDKTCDAPVFAGTSNLTGAVDVRVTAAGPDTGLGNVRRLIEAAERIRPPITRITDRYISYYTPVILAVAAILWFFTQDMMRVVYILVIACPCALIVATPSAVVAALSAASRLGIYIRNVDHIEIAAGIRSLVFDKTGTLTTGRLDVVRLHPLAGVELTTLVASAAAAESGSNHPVAGALARLAAKTNVVWQKPDTFSEVAGYGVEAGSDGVMLRAGRLSWFEELGFDTTPIRRTIEDDAEASGMSIIGVSRDDVIIGWLGFRDTLRPGAADAMAHLDRLGLTDRHMVTGDNASAAGVVAQALGIGNVQTDCLPGEKVDYVRNLKASGITVAVVGDGINDAPALASGDIGIAMGAAGSDVAVGSASVALMNDDVRRIPMFIELARRARYVVYGNLAIGAAVIVGGLTMFVVGDGMLNQIAGVVGIRPTLFKSIIAASIHILSTLAVFFNSARLIRFGDDAAPAFVQEPSHE